VRRLVIAPPGEDMFSFYHPCLKGVGGGDVELIHISPEGGAAYLTEYYPYSFAYLCENSLRLSQVEWERVLSTIFS